MRNNLMVDDESIYSKLSCKLGPLSRNLIPRPKNNPQLLFSEIIKILFLLKIRPLYPRMAHLIIH
jgi:hypothetical protein